MGADGYEDRKKGHRGEREKRISEIYAKNIKFVPNVPHVPFSYAIVYAEIFGWNGHDPNPHTHGKGVLRKNAGRFLYTFPN